MADVLAGFISGAKAGQAANVARKKAAAEAAEKERNYGLKVGTQAQVVQGAREDQMARLETMITSPDWEAANTPRALAMADSIDRSYGGTGAMSYLKTALSLGKTAETDEQGNKMYGGVKGGVGPVEQVGRQHAGYTGPTQKMTAQDRTQNARTQEMSNQIGVRAMKYIEDKQEPGMPLSPADGIRLLNEIELKMISEENLDPTIAAVEFDKLRRNMADFNEAIAKTNGESRERQESIDRITKDNTRWIHKMYGIDPGMMGGMTVFSSGFKPIIDQLEGFMHNLAANNVSHNQAKIYVWDAFRDELGKMPNIPDSELYSGMLAGTSPEFRSAVKAEYQTNGGRFNDYAKPYYDKETGQGYMIANPMAGQIPEGGIPIEGGLVALPMANWHPRMDRGPEPSAEVSTKDGSSVSDAGSGIDHSNGKRIDAPIPVDAEGFPVDARGDYYRNKRWDFGNGEWIKDESRTIAKIKGDVSGFLEKRSKRQKKQKEETSLRSRGLIDYGSK